MAVLATNGYSITQIWVGMDNQTGIEQPTKQSFLWKDLAVLAKESEIWNLILKSGKHIFRVAILYNYVAKLGQVWGSFIMVIKSLQSIPKLWHVEYWSMLSIAHRNTSTLEFKADSHHI